MAKQYVFGSARIKRELRKAPDQVKEALIKEIRIGAEKIRDAMVATLHTNSTRTGALARGVRIGYTSGGLSSYTGFSRTRAGFKRVFKTVGWRAHFIEFGTAHHGAEPFLRPNIRQYGPAIRARVKGQTALALARNQLYSRSPR